MNHFSRLLLSSVVVLWFTACPPVVGVDADAGDGSGGGTATTGGGTGTGGGGDATGGGTALDDGGTGGGAAAGGGAATGGGTATGGGNATGGGGGAFDAGSFIDANQFCDAWAQAYCGREARCGYLDPAQNMTCLARVKDDCATWQRQSMAGVYRYDTMVGAACVTATANLTCTAGRGFTGGTMNFTFGNGTVACDALVVGVGVANTPCTAMADCAVGFTCPGAGGNTACYACAALPTAGSVCNPAGGAQCFNSTCRGAGDGGNECFAFIAADQLCSGQGQCDPVTTRACGMQPNDGGVRRCVSKDVDGTPCNTSNACLTAYCNQGDRTDAGIRTCGTIVDGRPCGAVNDCVAASFCDGLRQGVPGVCTPRLALGAPCSIQRSGDTTDGCPAGASCFDGVCKVRANQQAVGQQCRSTLVDCVSGGFCPPLPNDGGYPSCVPQGQVFAACGASAECAAGLRCTNNVCVPLSIAGQPCLGPQQCKAALMCPQVDAGMGFFACAPLASPGADCSVAGTTCASGVDNGQGGFCLRDAGAGTCAAPIAVGMDCGGNGQCASGRCLSADGGVVVNGTRGTCAASCIP